MSRRITWKRREKDDLLATRFTRLLQYFLDLCVVEGLRDTLNSHLIVAPSRRGEPDAVPQPGTWDATTDSGGLIDSSCHAFPSAIRKVNVRVDTHYEPVSTVCRSTE